jgi:hypothetical protein
MAIGSTMAAILAGTSLAGAGTAYSISAAQGGPGDAPAQQIPSIEPAADTIDKSKQQAQAATQSRLKAARASKSIYSSPLGIGGEASVARKTLLGQ